uniref:Uncharacterized protein n=1 Tax=Timema monikensis TaxID=170555 RepID=A0A7R9HK71_9NEOP|nr:unnamed protein product [Timema monikensis]
MIFKNMCLAAVTSECQNLGIYLNIDCQKSAVSCQSATKKLWGYCRHAALKIFPDEANVNKGKKSWGERLKLGRGVDKDRPVPHQTPRDADNNPYLLQEYRNKYGTLSGGSALSKSMKYAEPWLYGSMSGPPGSNACPQRPALFLYHHPPPPVTVIPEVRQHSVVMVSPTSPASNYAVVVCSCPEFLTGTQRNKKNSPVCKKCGGSRVMWGGGTVRAPGHVMTSGGTVTGMGGTVRVGVGGPTRIRPSLLSVKPLPSNPPPQKPMTPDPYDMMRRNRLGSITPTEMSRKFSIAETTEGRSRQSQFETGRVRAKSTSPGRRNMRRSPSPPSRDSRKTHRHSPESQRRLSRRELEWEEDNLNLNFAMDSPDGSKRKSILECDVNAYELIAKYLKNGGKLLEDRNGGKRLNNETFTSDDDVLDDDELSDNMSDNALEDLPKSGVRNSNERFIAHKNMSRLPSSTASHLKTDRNIKRRFESVQKTKPVTSSNKGSSNSVSPISNGNSPRSCGITIGGQTIKIFNGSNPSTVEEDGEYVSDDAMIDDHVGSEVIHDIPRPTEEIKENQRVTRSSPNNSMIPRLSSPRRPPRKLKNSFGGSNRDETESFVIEKRSTQVTNSGPAESGSLSISHAGTNVTSSPLPEVSTIKSILKKPSTTSPGATEASPSLKTFGDTISKPDRSASGGGRRAASITTTTTNTSPSPLTGSASCTAGSNFYLPTFQEYKQQNRKKKQVQFKVAGDEQVTQVQYQPDDQHAVSPPSSDYVINPSSLKRPLPKTGQDGPLIAVKNDIKAKATQNDVPTITQDNAEENVITVISDEKVQKSFDTTLSSSNKSVLTSSDTVEDRVTLEGRLKGGDFQYFGDSEGDTTVLNCSGVLKSSYEQDEFGTAPDHGVVGQSIPAVYFGQYGVPHPHTNIRIGADTTLRAGLTSRVVTTTALRAERNPGRDCRRESYSLSRVMDQATR